MHLTARIPPITPQNARPHATGVARRQAGMLFVFDEAAIHCKWMKNTLIPLSVAFIDEGGTIINLADMHSTESRRIAAARALFALEMTRGWFAQRGVKPGMKLGGLERLARRR